MRPSSPAICCARRSTVRSPWANRCHAVPPGPTPANRRCARQSSMSLLGRKGRWVCSSEPWASPAPEPRSVSPTSCTTCSEWSGSPADRTNLSDKSRRRDQLRHRDLDPHHRNSLIIQTVEYPAPLLQKKHGNWRCPALLAVPGGRGSLAHEAPASIRTLGLTSYLQCARRSVIWLQSTI
jgi:hypothetical protein